MFSKVEVLQVSYCDHLSCFNIFSSVTSGSIGMKLNRKHPLNDFTRISPNCWDPNRILATKWKKLWNSSSPKLVGRFSNKFAEIFLGWHSTRFHQAIVIGQKNGHQGPGLFCLIDRFLNDFVEIFLGWPSLRFLPAMVICKKLATRRQGKSLCIFQMSDARAIMALLFLISWLMQRFPPMG